MDNTSIRMESSKIPARKEAIMVAQMVELIGVLFLGSTLEKMLKNTGTVWSKLGLDFFNI